MYRIVVSSRNTNDPTCKVEWLFWTGGKWQSLISYNKVLNGDPSNVFTRFHDEVREFLDGDSGAMEISKNCFYHRDGKKNAKISNLLLA